MRARRADKWVKDVPQTKVPEMLENVVVALYVDWCSSVSQKMVFIQEFWEVKRPHECVYAVHESLQIASVSILFIWIPPHTLLQ